MELAWYEWTAFILVIIGAINWGLFSFDVNLVNLIFGSVAWLESLVYWLVGISGLYLLYYLFK